MKTQDARWLRIRDLFEQAMDLTPTQRESFLDQHCGNDSDLRLELKSLLASDANQNNGPLTGAIGAAVEATTTARRQELLGSVIGPYRLTSVLGHGGAGTVYLAERVDRQYSAQVAVKVVEGAALSAEIGRRFRAERQILANLNHPNIARLIDAGETPQGYPYLVMEYVHGESINDYCDRVKLSIEDRIQLVLRVCGALQYAHQNLVVHRDIKPANVLVTPDGTPKLLDFGIAKLLDTESLAAEMALTRMNDRVLTPEYASPEQILGQPVTTASDVYALGVVLYELLTGLRPYKVSSASQLELERTICVIEPVKPSSAIKQSVSRGKKDSPSVAPNTIIAPATRDMHTIVAARRITPSKLVARLGGDIDAILMRALRKEPIYRYSSVEQFAADLRRHLAREPVLARQGNWFYYTRRYVRRNALPVAGAVAFFALLAGTAINYSIQSKRIAVERDIANREKQTSDAVADFMVNVFAASDPFEAQGREITANELLEKSTQSIHDELDQQPAVRARLLEAMGKTYTRQGHFDRGIELLEDALAIREKQTNPDSIVMATTLLNIGKAYLNKRDYHSAERPLLAAQHLLETANKTHTSEYAMTLQRLAALENQRGNNSIALDYYRQSLTLLKEVYGPHNPEYAGGLSDYANALLWADNYVEAERATREAVEIYRTTKPKTYPDRMNAEGMLGRILLQLGHLDQAAPVIENHYRLQKEVFGESSQRLLTPLVTLVRLYLEQEKLPAAEQYARMAVALISNESIDQSYRSGQMHETLGIVLWQRNKLVEAEKELREALTIYGKTLPPDHLYVATSEHFLAEVLLATNRSTMAISQLQTTIARLQRVKADAWRIARSESTLGFAFEMTGNFEEALQYSEKSYAVLTNTPGVSADSIRLARARLERIYFQHNYKQKFSDLHRQDIRPKLTGTAN